MKVGDIRYASTLVEQLDNVREKLRVVKSHRPVQSIKLTIGEYTDMIPREIFVANDEDLINSIRDLIKENLLEEEERLLKKIEEIG